MTTTPIFRAMLKIRGAESRQRTRPALEERPSESMLVNGYDTVPNPSDESSSKCIVL